MYNNIEEQVRETILSVTNELVAYEKKGDRPWTRAIMTALTELAYEKFNYWVYSTPNDHDDTVNEWLYDMTWYDAFDDKGRDVKNIHLILESEWSRNIEEVLYDFRKLLQGRAGLRVFIFQSADVESIMNVLAETIRKSPISQPNDRFLLIGWNDNNGITFMTHYK